MTYHEAKRIIGAAAVLISAIIAIVVGGLIFIPKFLT